MNYVNEGNFKQEVLDYQGIVLVDFYADWCPPCKMLSPILEELSNDTNLKAKIVKLNVDENNKIAIDYMVRSVPTIIYFKSGKMVDKVVGFEDKETILKRIENIS